MYIAALGLLLRSLIVVAIAVVVAFVVVVLPGFFSLYLSISFLVNVFVFGCRLAQKAANLSVHTKKEYATPWMAKT